MFFLGCDEAHLHSMRSINETVDANCKQTPTPTNHTILVLLFSKVYLITVIM